VGVDSFHCSKSSVKAFIDQMAQALEGRGSGSHPLVPCKPGITRDDLFKINAGIVKGICDHGWRTASNRYLLAAMIEMSAGNHTRHADCASLTVCDSEF
jgi:malate dehydrogenase